MVVKFLKKGIRSNGLYIPVFYSKGSYTKESKIPKGTITVYARKYGSQLPGILKPINESSGQTDYFEKDRARILPRSKFYKRVSKFVL